MVTSNQEVSHCSHEVDCTNGIITYPPNVESIGESSDGCCDYYHCKTCGHQWKVCYEG